MEVNLRKAKALQDAIRTEMGKVRGTLSGSRKVNVYDDTLPELVQEYHRDIENAFDASNRLRNALFEIRRETSTANYHAGIDNLLADVAEVEMVVALCDDVINRGEAPTMQVVEKTAEVARQSNVNSDSYSQTASINVGGTQFNLMEEAKSMRAAAKRTTMDLKDELLGKNVTTKIILSEETVDTLKAAGII